MLSIRKMDLVEACGRYAWQACALSMILGIAMMLTYGSEVYMILMLGFRITSVVALFGMARFAHWGQTLCNSVADAPFSQKGQALLCLTQLRFGAGASYFIYLAHYVLFFGFVDSIFFGLFGDSTASLCVHYLICPLIKACLLIAIYCGYRAALRKITGR
jgi:hypothetical protein